MHCHCLGLVSPYLITQLSRCSCLAILRGCQLENCPATSTLEAPASSHCMETVSTSTISLEISVMEAGGVRFTVQFNTEYFSFD